MNINPHARFILWDQRDCDGRGPRRDEEGRITSDGLLGRLGPSNCYLKTYAANLRRDSLTAEGGYKTATLEDLEINGHEPVIADFSLSGERGTYEIYRLSDAPEKEPQ